MTAISRRRFYTTEQGVEQMNAGPSSTAHYEDVLRDLRDDYERLRKEADEALAVARSKESAANDLAKAVAVLEARSVGGSDHSQVQLAEFLRGLQLGDACIAVLERIGRPSTNREIFEALDRYGFRVNSENPINNIGSCLHHRAANKGDVERTDNKCWALKKGEGLAIGEASQLNGATVPAV